MVKKLKILPFVLIPLMLALYAAPTVLSPTMCTTVNGDYTYSPVWTNTEEHGNHMLINIDQDTWFTGDFVGSWEPNFVLSLNIKTQEWTAWGSGTFTGAIGDKTGTFTIRAVGYGAFGSNYYFHNVWIITDGTGDFVNMHGHGTFDTVPGSYDSATYSGSVFFTN